MEDDCIFCKIASGEIPADKVYEDDTLIAFKDINPVSPVHLLIIPKKHIPTLNELQTENAELLGNMILIAGKLAKDNNIQNEGYRLVLNCNKGAGQMVFHIHLHLLGGRKFSWPPG